MTVRAKTGLNTTYGASQRGEAATSQAAKPEAPMVQRLSTHRDRIDMAVAELQGERLQLLAKRDQMRRQIEALERGFSVHLDDIELTLNLYEGGLRTICKNSD